MTHISGPLVRLPAFRVQMIQWDGMHIINLGVDLWIIGSVVRKMLQYDLWGGMEMDEGDRLLVAYEDFKTYCRVNNMAHHG